MTLNTADRDAILKRLQDMSNHALAGAVIMKRVVEGTLPADQVAAHQREAQMTLVALTKAIADLSAEIAR